MAKLNKVMLIGNLTRDPELKYTPGNQAVCEVGLAVNRKYRTKDGEDREDGAHDDGHPAGTGRRPRAAVLGHGSPSRQARTVRNRGVLRS